MHGMKQSLEIWQTLKTHYNLSRPEKWWIIYTTQSLSPLSVIAMKSSPKGLRLTFQQRDHGKDDGYPKSRPSRNHVQGCQLYIK